MKILGVMSVSLLVAVMGSSHAACDPGTHVARQFVNGYAQRQEPALVYVHRSELVTEEFKQSFSTAAMGQSSDIDPLLNVRQAPANLDVTACDAKSQWVTLAAPGNAGYKLVVKMANTPRGWRVDGAGSVNVPPEQRAPLSR